MLTSITLMIIAKEKTTHKHTTSERVSKCKRVLYHNTYMRHHHVAFVELRPSLEAPPRYSRGITPLYGGTTNDSH